MDKYLKKAWIYFAAASVIIFVSFLGYLNMHKKLAEKNIAYVSDTNIYAFPEAPVSIPEPLKEEKVIEQKSQESAIQRIQKGPVYQEKEIENIKTEAASPAIPQPEMSFEYSNADKKQKSLSSQKSYEPPQFTTEAMSAPEEVIVVEDEIILEDIEADYEVSTSRASGKKMISLEKEDEEEKVFITVDDMPTFKGKGIEGFREYTIKNLKYPKKAAEEGISGRIFIQFVVNTKGKVVDVVVVRGIDPSLDEEALRVVKSSPKWEPGRQRGKPVNVQFTFPIEFKLD